MKKKVIGLTLLSLLMISSVTALADNVETNCDGEEYINWSESAFEDKNDPYDIDANFVRPQDVESAVVGNWLNGSDNE